jgi:hypothetical protein
MAVTVWILAALIYLAFRLWYDGLGKPLTRDEIARFSGILQGRAGGGPDSDDMAALRRFMEEDDGREFIMVNLIQFNPSPLPHPDTGRDIRAPELLAEYTKPFMRKIFRRAGHPVIAGMGVGGYLDAWNTPPDPGWHMAGLVRYRSRRDVVELSLADPSFQAIHKYKIAAMKQTFAFPMKTRVAFYASPRVTVALVLALVAALLQLMVC